MLLEDSQLVPSLRKMLSYWNPPSSSVDSVTADLQAKVREQVRQELLRHGASDALNDPVVFASLDALLHRATRAVPAGTQLMPEFLGDPATWRLETALAYRSHRGGAVASAWEGQTALVHFDPADAPSTTSGATGADASAKWKTASLSATAPPPRDVSTGAKPSRSRVTASRTCRRDRSHAPLTPKAST